MRIVSFKANDVKSLGLRIDENVFRIDQANINDLIEDWGTKEKEITDIYEKIKLNPDEFESYRVDEIELFAPFEHPNRNVICVGKNYKEHALELEGKTANFMGIPKEPIYFTKAVDRIITDKDDLSVYRDVTTQVDYEVELAIVISKKCHRVAPQDAKNYIFGYAVANDYSARDLQTKHNQWFKGKSLDAFTAMGTEVVTSSAIEYPPALDIKSSVNGEIRQDSNTRRFIFDLDYLISDLSKGMTLFPGDIILTGTPEGVGMGFEPPKYLKDGDTVECKIDKVGTMTNRIVFK